MVRLSYHSEGDQRMNKSNGKKHDLAHRLREARKVAGFSQGQLAKELNMHRPTISEIEAGNRKVSAAELTRFAEIFGVTVGWLLDQKSARKVSVRANAADMEWTEELNARRCQLIDKKIQGTLLDDEAGELDALQEAVQRHADRVAPLPFEAAKRLHAALLKKQKTKK